MTPALLCAALACGLAAQFVLPKTTEFGPTAPALIKRPKTPVGVPVPDYPAVLGRPLFSPDRRSLAGVGEGVGATATVEGQPPVVIGVASDRRAGSAVVRGADGTVQVVRLGQTWRGWRLVAIGTQGAAFSGPGGRFTARIGATPPSPSQVPALQDARQ